MEDATDSNFNNRKIIVHMYDAPRDQGTTPEILMDVVYSNRKYQQWNKADLSFLKEDNPTIPEKDLECLSVEITLNEILGEGGYGKVVRSVASAQTQFSKTEAQAIWILLDLLKSKPEYVMSYVYGNGIFPGLLFKERNAFTPDCLSFLNDILKQNPKWPVEMAMACLSRKEKYPPTLHEKLDRWLGYHLNKLNFKKLAKNQEFVGCLASYLRYGAKEENGVSCLVCSRMDAFSEDDQHLLWDQIFHQNTNEQRRCEAILTFLSGTHSAVANKVFYSQLHSNVSCSEFENILGKASAEIKKNYFRLVKEQKQDLAQIKMRCPQTEDKKFLVWDLHARGKVAGDEMVKILQDHDGKRMGQPAKRSFLYQDKELLNWDVFKAGCQKMKASPIQLLMWVSSYKNTPNFASFLASGWETLPVEMRQNNNIQLAMDNHFDLFYGLAQKGNTGMLNEIMKTMKNNQLEFLHRFMRPHKDGNTSLHQLCLQGKKGVLKLLDQLPKSEQQRLLNQKNDLGQTPLDLCSTDFRRFLDQKNFIRPVSEVQKTVTSTPKAPEVSPVKSVKTDQPVKKFIWRSRFKSKRYIDDCEKFKNQPNVIKGAWREIAKLRSMPWTDLKLRMGQDIKRNLKSRLCAADFSADGNAYRMGYLLQDGVVGLLFIMTHQQYNTGLQINGPIDTMALNVRKQIMAQVAQQNRDGRH